MATLTEAGPGGCAGGGGRIPSLDGLRALGIGAVLLSHAVATAGFPITSMRPIGFGLGVRGVSLFFAISGYLITTLLLRERDRAGSISLRGFYARRSLRILPAYAAYLAFVAAIQWAGETDVPAGHWLAALTYTVNFVKDAAWEVSHVWSLSIEEHFYLLWPAAVVLAGEAGAAKVAICALAAGPMLRLVALLLDPTCSPMLMRWTFTRCDAIAAGCLLALLARRPGPRDWLDRRAATAVGVVLSLAGLGAAWAIGRLLGRAGQVIAPTVEAASLAMLLWAAIARPPRWLSARPLVVVGVLSYSLYLWQQPFLSPARSGAPAWRAWPTNLMLAVVCAVVSYLFVERPALRLKDRLRRPS